MNTFRAKAIAVALLVGLALPAAALDVAIEYQRYPSQEEQQKEREEGKSVFRPWGSGSLELKKEAPEGDWKLPKLVAKRPIYAEVTLGDSTFLLVYDKQEAGDTFYNRVYFDANGNRDLTDDPAVDGDVSEYNDGQNYYGRFPALDTIFTLGGVKLPFSFMPQINYWSQQSGAKAWGSWFKRLLSKKPVDVKFENVHAYYSVNCCYGGEFVLGDAAYTVLLGDTNGNGLVDDTFSLPEGDFSMAYIYAQGDQFFLRKEAALTFYDGLTLGQTLYVQDTLYQVAIDTPGKNMTLTPVAEGLGTLSLAAAPERLNLHTHSGQCVMAFRPGKTIRVPADSYRLLSYQLYRNDPQDDRWHLQAGGGKEGQVVSLAANATAPLALGEPFTPRVDLARWAMENIRSGGTKEVRIEFNLYGAAQEVVTDLSRLSGKATDITMSPENPSRPLEPAYRILKKDGEIAAKGKFEYG